MTPTRRNVVIGVVLLVGFGIGLGLVLFGGDDNDGVSNDGGDINGAPAPASIPPASTRPADPPDPEDRLGVGDEVGTATLADLADIVVPENAADFLTARLDDGTQLDVTFTMPADAVAEFLARSALPSTTPDERLILHSSPLWRLNPEAGQALSSTSDETEEVRRTVELVEETPDTVRARITIIPR